VTPEPEADTEISVNGITFIDKVMSKYPEVVFQPHLTHLLEFFFLFSLKVLDGNEPLPKGAAAEFWVSLFRVPYRSPFPYPLSPIPFSHHHHPCPTTARISSPISLQPPPPRPPPPPPKKTRKK
jgi:hypothetical protein